MFKYAGIWRSEKTLKHVIKWCESWGIDFADCANLDITKAAAERLDMLTVAWLIATSALDRTESRGGHMRIDYPNEEEIWRQKSIIREVSKVEQY
ncbi:hypothetical protein QS257_15820 [Terrilactibacillus sp. S3-3]|nr:hypothetical protein QS257_15820 [Terrilactibacillus sp. S3-3]